MYDVMQWLLHEEAPNIVDNKHPNVLDNNIILIIPTYTYTIS